MKNILVLTGSPRRGGNSDTLADAFIKGAQSAGHHVDRFETAHHKIAGCRACDNCFTKDTACSVKDGFTDLEPLLEKADALILVTPLYWFGFSAQIKCAIDRLYCYVSEKCTRPLKISESILMVCGGDDDTGMYSGAVENYKNMVKYMEWTDRGILIAPGVMDKGDINGTFALKDAEKMGRDF